MNEHSAWRLATQAVHAGKPNEAPSFRPTVTAIHPSVTYSYPSMQALDGVLAGDREGYVYARYGSPTVAALEEAAAVLEGGEAALAFASGMAAIHAALLGVGALAGTAVVVAQDIYGATHSLLDQLMGTQGVTTRFVDANDLEAVELACAELEPVALLVETISNPLLKVANLPALTNLASRHRTKLLVDSTFATPYLARPLTMGADMVIHSTTKYLAGHGDVLGGLIVTSTKLHADLLEILKLTGANQGPQEAWLTLRGIRTLGLRMRRHCENALCVAEWLDGHPRVTRVLYPGLSSHPQHSLSKSLFGGRGYGGVLSFEIRDAGQEEVFRFFESLNLCLPSTTLGDVHSLFLYPAHSSHRALSSAERARIGIGNGLVRMSVGIEAVEDVLEDLDQALDTLG